MALLATWQLAVASRGSGFALLSLCDRRRASSLYTTGQGNRSGWSNQEAAKFLTEPARLWQRHTILPGSARP